MKVLTLLGICFQMKIDKGVVRIAKLKTNPFSDDGGLMTDWHHPKCVFETFARARVGMCLNQIYFA